jgi:uncharacterized SAM-binding protein YcdF (DUF218 family)
MYEFIVYLLQPHVVLMLVVGWSVFRLWRKRNDPKRRMRLLVISLLALAVISTPIVAHLALLVLESRNPPREKRPAEADAIVVFTAGLYPPGGTRLQAELDEDSLHRCLHTVRLYNSGPPCPVLVSGGKVDPDTPGPTCAAEMSDLLKKLGVSSSDLIREESSRSTYENAVECARQLKEREIRRVVLVVDAVDMPRAAACLRKQGIEVFPAPCHFRASEFKLTPFSFLPNLSSSNALERAWHECLGIAWYWCRGRL